MRNYALDTKLLPKVWVSWTSTKNGEFNGRYWLNCQTGKKKSVPEPWMDYESERTLRHWQHKYPLGVCWRTRNNDKIWVASGSNLYYAYAKYHKDIGRLEIAAVTMDTSRKPNARTWEYAGSRFFIGKDKTVIDHNGVLLTRFNCYQYHYAYSGKEMLSMLLRLNHYQNNIVSEFKKFIGGESFVIGNGSTVKVNSTYDIQRWYETVQKARSKGKQQRITDELVKMPVSDVSCLAYKYRPIQQQDCYGYTTSINGIVYFERLTDGWCVLRSFARHDNGRDLSEEWRMYINDDGRSRIVSKSGNDWIPSAQIRNRWGSRSYLANKTEAIANCNRIKYIMSTDSGVDLIQEVDFLVTALRFPVIEQLIKLGCGKMALRVTQGHTPMADLKDNFGGYFNDKEPSLLRKVGLTKHQFDTYMGHQCDRDSWEYKKALQNMRRMFGNDLSHMDNNSFDEYFEAMRYIVRSFYRGLTRYTDDFNLDELRFFKNLVRLGKKNNNAYGLAHDAMNDYRYLALDTMPDVDWYFDSYSDLVRVHDAITELKRAQDAERRARWDISERERLEREEKKREELDKQRKEYEYEDDDYIIRLPKTLAEIVNEGSVQRICIGGYTSRHATGGTNLFFLRKKSDEDTPFYAIEMSNSKVIVQIHGYCNQWLGNDPDAIPTVVRWLRKNGIKCDEKIRTCKAKGYGSTNDYVVMPVVD